MRVSSPLSRHLLRQYEGPTSTKNKNGGRQWIRSVRITQGNGWRQSVAISSVSVRVGLGSSRLKDERTENCEMSALFFGSSSPGRNESKQAASRGQFRITGASG